jgi:phospholipid/cholesterol/gamma-HCH transport system permease protein
MRYLINLYRNIRKSVAKTIKFYGGIASLIIFSTNTYITDKKGRSRINKVILMQIYFTGNLAIKIIGLVALALGAITVMQLFTQLNKVGMPLDLVGKILNIVIVRELGPIITAIIIISRSGTAIAAEIGTMMVNDEVNALEMLGINTLKFIVFPRIAGMVIGSVILTIYFCAIGIIGGFLVGSLSAGITLDIFTTYVMNSISILDILMSMLKSAVFGLFISTIAIFYGFQAFESTQIPQMTTKAVVSSIFGLFIIDVIITMVSYI